MTGAPAPEEPRDGAAPVRSPDAVAADRLGAPDQDPPEGDQAPPEGAAGTHAPNETLPVADVATETEPGGDATATALEAAVVDGLCRAAATSAPTAPSPAEPDQATLRLAEALVFASGGPVGLATLSRLIPSEIDAATVISALQARYAGRGVELVEVAGGVQFRTAPDLAPRLRTVIEVPRRLPRVAMETLAIIAYHQPVTRPEIEEIRGASLSQQTLDALLEANLVAPQGRRESPGRPTLWGTTPQFLAQFGLKELRDLPRRDDLLVEPPQPAAPPAAGPASDGEPPVAQTGQENVADDPSSST